MSRYLPAAASLSLFALLILACNGDGNPEATVSPTGEVTPTPGPTTSPTTSTRTATPSPSPQGTPTGTTDTTPTATPTGTPTTPTPTPIPAVAPDDLAAFLAQYRGQTIDEATCQFDPRTGLSSCPGRGTYAIDPPLSGQDIECSVLIVQDEPIAIRCTSQEPLKTLYYAVQ
jgi:hypothetical protein